MFYLFHGDDEFSSHEQLSAWRQKDIFGFNRDIYYGADANIKAISMTMNTLPFLSEQRLVIVEGLPKKKRGADSAVATANEESPKEAVKGGKTGRGKKGSKTGPPTRASFEKELAEQIATMPDTTVLIVLVEEALEASNPLLKAAEQHGKIVQSMLPKGAALESWIVKRAKSLGVNIAMDAKKLLADFVGNNVRLLANELDKLATYVGKGATISIEDIRQLCAQVQEARIFDLTDALAQRNRQHALNILHDLLSDGEPPLKLLSTITSQIRSLLLVKELSQKGMRAPQIASTLSIAPFIVEKALRQVGKFNPAQLDGAYHQLLETDAALKRSRLTPEMALDLLVVHFG